MTRYLFDKRCKEFLAFVNSKHRLPKVWEVCFTDGYDMRLWVNGIKYDDELGKYYKDIMIALDILNIRLLSDEEKEKEFLKYIETFKKIPLYDESYFSDNSDMRMWYMHYKNENIKFERLVRDLLPEYQDFDIAMVWPNLEKEFVGMLKRLKRIPNYGEFYTTSGIDIRAIYDKLESYDAKFIEELLLDIKSSKGLSYDNRESQLIAWISINGYIPYLQEARFSDSVDMFTWYMHEKDKSLELKDKVEKIVYDFSNKKVNIYFIPEFRKNEGKFYTICSNVGEKLDLSGIASFREAKKLDSSLVRVGKLTLKKDEEIGSINIGGNHNEN